MGVEEDSCASRAPSGGDTQGVAGSAAGEQGLAIAQVVQGQEGLDGETWGRRIVHVAARERIEHPRGKSQLKAILAFENQTLRGLTSSPSDDFDGLIKEGGGNKSGLSTNDE